MSDDLTVGTEVARREVTVDRARLVRYAGASGDFNPIHWNARVATSVGLPDVIAHGMWTMGAAVSVVADWAGDPGKVVDYQVRFTRPVPVPDPGCRDDRGRRRRRSARRRGRDRAHRPDRERRRCARAGQGAGGRPALRSVAA